MVKRYEMRHPNTKLNQKTAEIEIINPEARILTVSAADAEKLILVS